MSGDPCLKIYSENSSEFKMSSFGSYDERENKMDIRNPQRVENGYPGVTGPVTAAHMSNSTCF